MAVPFCVVGLFLATLFMPGRAASGPPRRFDWIGFGLMTVFLVTLLNGLSNGQRDGWMSDTILSHFAIAFVTGMGFLTWELRTQSPMLNLKLFTNPVYAAASVVAFIFGAGIYGSTYLVPLFVQTIQGYTPTRSGLLLMPAGLILAIVFPVAGRLSDKTPAYATVMFGLAAFALSSFLMSGVDTNTSFWLFAWWLIFGRVGLGFVFPSLTVGGMRALPPHLISQGAGLTSYFRQLGAAFGITALATTVHSRSAMYGEAFVSTQTAGNEATSDFLRTMQTYLSQAGTPEALQKSAALHHLGQTIFDQALMIAFRDGFFIVALVFLAAIILSVFLGRIKGG